MTIFRCPIAGVLAGILFAGTGAAAPAALPTAPGPDGTTPGFQGRMDWAGPELEELRPAQEG